MNGDTKKSLALGAIALSVGVALGVVLGNDRTRQSLIDRSNGFADRSKGFINRFVDRSKEFINNRRQNLTAS